MAVLFVGNEKAEKWSHSWAQKEQERRDVAETTECSSSRLHRCVHNLLLILTMAMWVNNLHVQLLGERMVVGKLGESAGLSDPGWLNYLNCYD
jgi:hypothetical protein